MAVTAKRRSAKVAAKRNPAAGRDGMGAIAPAIAAGLAVTDGPGIAGTETPLAPGVPGAGSGVTWDRQALLGLLSPGDGATLVRIMEEDYGYMANPLFEREDAAKVIFEDGPEIPEPDTSWYQPFMDGAGEEVVNVARPAALVLTGAQERSLFLRFNYCRYRVAQLRERFSHETPGRELARQALEWHRKARALREQIANTNLALVPAMIRHFRNTDLLFGDMVSEGNMALLRAIDKFDVERGFKFSTYACRAILKAFSRAGTVLSKRRNLFAVEYDPEFERSDHLERKREDIEHDCTDELRRIITANAAHLTDLERKVIAHRFPMGDKPHADAPTEALTLGEVGQLVGYTKERVRQIQKAALEKLRVALERQYLD